MIDQYLEEYLATKRPSKENANFNYNLSGCVHHAYSKQLKDWSLRQYDKLGLQDVTQAHKEGDIHIHNLIHAFLAGYCTGWNLDGILSRGLKLGAIESYPAKHFDVALDHIVNFGCNASQEWSGAMAFGDFDVKLAPYVARDGLTLKETKQQLQRLIWNFNYPSRYGGQSPFINVTLHLGVPDRMKNIPSVCDGNAYGDYEREVLMIDQAIFEVLSEGDSRGRPFTFPIPTVTVRKGFDWESDIAQQLLTLSATRGSPYYLNYCSDAYDENESLAMCCRLKLDLNDAKKHAGGIWNIGDNTGSIGVVTINLPRVGLLNDEDKVYERLFDLMYTARRQLQTKRQIVTKRILNGLLPVSKFYLKTFEFHFSTIGFCGFHEMCENFLGKPITDKESIKFVLRVLKFMRNTVERFTREEQVMYNIEATPAEETAAEFARKDLQKFGPSVAKEALKGFYTNSYHCPVDLDVGLFERLKIESTFHPLTTGGTVFHTFLGEQPNTQSLGSFLHKALHKTPVAYMSITPSLAICDECGMYEVSKNPVCPTCGATDREIWSRIVGYYRPTKRWNEGKVKEFELRNHYSIDDSH